MKNTPTEPAKDSMCNTCIHRVYCGCVGKTGYCGNYTNKAARVRDGRWEPFHPVEGEPRSRLQRP